MRLIEGKPKILTLEVEGTLPRVREAVLRAVRWLDQQGLSKRENQDWELALTEAANNAVIHGPSAAGSTVKLELLLDAAQVEARIFDRTKGFILPEGELELPDPLSESGRGLYLIRSLTDSIRYLRDDGGNCLVLRRARAGPAAPDEDLEATLQSMTEELAAAYESLSAIFRFSAELIQGQPTETLVRRWLEELCLITRTDWCRLRVLKSSGTAKLFAHDAAAGAKSAMTPPRESAVEAQAAAKADDVWFDERSGGWQEDDPLLLVSEPHTPLSGICHPIFISGQFFGTLTMVMRKEGCDYRAGDLNVIHTFADFLGVQLRNAEAQQERLASRLLSRELEIAANIQRSLLPVNLPQPKGFQLAGHAQTAQQVGGDFFDVVEVPGEGVLLAIADVMGKGVPAALFAAIFRSHLRSRLDLAPWPGKLLTWLNQVLFADLDRVDMFITAQVAFLRPENGALKVAGAGHCPLLARVEGSPLISIDSDGPPLGISPNAVYEPKMVWLNTPGMALLFTDGLVEFGVSPSISAGMASLTAWLERQPICPAGVLRDGLRDFLNPLATTARACDDLTFLAVSSGPIPVVSFQTVTYDF